MDKLTPGQVAQVLREVRDCFGATVSVMRRIDQLQDEEAARREDQESAEPFKSCNDCTSPLTCHNQQFCPTAKGRAQLGNGPVGLMRLGQTPGAVSGPTVPNGEREGLDSAATPPAVASVGEWQTVKFPAPEDQPGRVYSNAPPAADELVFDKAAADRAARALIPDAPDELVQRLRHYAANLGNPFTQKTCYEAAARIEADARKIAHIQACHEETSANLSQWINLHDQTQTERDALRVKLHNALSNHALQLKRTNETYRALQKTEAELGERNIAYDAIEAELQLRKDQLERAYAELAEARALIKKTAHVLARAFDRIHCLPRTSDTELANEISATIAALAKEQP